MHKTIKRLNNEYGALNRDAQNRLLRQRVKHSGRKGRVQQIAFKEKGLLLSILLDDGHLVADVDPFMVEFDP